MFGYIQPLKSELKVCEYEYYRSAYCGLCNSLKKQYGVRARFIVNYDFVFIALLLSYSEKSDEEVSKKRCFVCPKGRLCIRSEIYDKVADISVILTYLKLCDDIDDYGFFKGFFKGRLPRFLLKKAYKNAITRMPEYNACTLGLFDELCLLEKNQCESLDETADKFALMLSGIITENSSRCRILKEIFYHIGRFVYIIDALDDFDDDVQKGEYNPIASRFKITDCILSEDVKEQVVITLEDSRIAVLKAFELLEQEEHESMLRNIIELGMINSIQRVISKGDRKNE